MTPAGSLIVLRRLATGKLKVCTLFILIGSASLTAAPPEPPAGSATLLSAEGTVEVLAKDAKAWGPGKPGQILEPGHRLRTGAKSRALLRLSNLSVLRVGELMEYEIQPPRAAGGKPTLDVKAGAAYFFSRDKPRELNLRTPVATGAIRGTEFNVFVAEDGKTTLTLIDGEVELATAQGSVVLGNGEQGVAQAGQPPSKTSVINAINVVQWSLYYPGVLDPDELGLASQERESLSETLAAYRNGDLPRALNAYPPGRKPSSPAETVYHAQLLLAAGLVPEAQADLSSIHGRPEQNDRLANSLKRLIAAVTLQTLETGPAPELASEWIAESYYQQSRSQLPEALAAARKSVEKSPAFGFGWARVAELEFSFGHRRAALEALEKSLSSAPSNAQAIALKGFLRSGENRISEAIDLFNQAISLDGSLANAWLGRGLCEIRRGHAQAGREDLETAAALEPNRSVLRSYLGKAFSETGDDRRADHELSLARRLDPNDPTSWLYSALLRQQENRINEAIADLEQSELLNENRRVYRSRMMLDQDEAVRGANLASIYRDAGMIDLSTREATRAVNYDYANYSAHLFLANSYNELRDPNQINLRYETPWLSEFLIANLLAPVGAGTLSQTVSDQDYSKLFEQDGLGVASSTEYFSRGDWVEAGSQYGSYGNFGYALDTLYRSSNGWRPNNDQQQLTLSLQTKAQVTPDDIVYFQALYYDASAGDLTQYYNQSQAHLALRTEENQEPLLLAGYNHEWAPGVHTLLLAGRFVDNYTVTDTNQQVAILGLGGSNQVVAVPTPTLPTAGLHYDSDLEIYSVEGQQIFQNEKHTLIFGARYQSGDFDTHSGLGASTPTLLASMTQTSVVAFASAPITQNVSSAFERITGYAYYSLQLFEPLQLTAGVAYDWLQSPVNYRNPPIAKGEETQDQISPKAGFTWTPLRDTVVRFAYTRSLQGVSFDQSVRLEPSQVDGFNQAFRSLMPESVVGSTSGAEFETFGLAFEQKLPTRTYLGIQAQILDSNVGRQVGVVDLNFPPTFSASTTTEHLDYTEKDLLVTLNQLIGNSWSVGVRYWLSKAELGTTFPQIPASVSSAAKTSNDATLNQLNLFAIYNCRCGFFARGEALWNHQVNGGYNPALAGDDFWQFNLFAGYRFWQRHAQVQVGVLNLTDQDYQLNPLNFYPEFPRQREFAVSFQFQF